MRLFLFAFLIALPSAAGAIVIRDDVDDSEYRVPASEFPALVDMPKSGHGVLVAPQWVITAAHTIPRNSRLRKVSINGKSRRVERVVIHEGYRRLPQELIDQAVATGDASSIVAFVSSSDDIALVKLAKPVTDVAPVALYEDSLRPGEIVKIIGKGTAGNGTTGYSLGVPSRTELRRAYNEITRVDDRWVCYRFDAPSSALALEGALGNGDSGGPVLVQVEGRWLLSGLASWKVIDGPVLSAKYGRYGQETCNVRLGHYLDWIGRVIAGQP
ncbi:MAG: trypsin-like serine protease [Pseudoxanthomonas sp.]|nr:trypsin-like serine protease [Pseudoxanthomonas sp.]